uniref:Basic tail secreted protein n=1 Tax=Rhipicephalus zambeziensis TaxID=60191 RepID=A0A224YGQ7_9ACAR
MTTYKFSFVVVLLFTFIYCNDTKPQALQRQGTRKRPTLKGPYDDIPNNHSITCPPRPPRNLTCKYYLFSSNGTTRTGKRLCNRPDNGTCSRGNGGHQRYGKCLNGTCIIPNYTKKTHRSAVLS